MYHEVFLSYCFLSCTIRQIFLCLIYIASSIADTGVNLYPFSLQQPLLDIKAVTVWPFSSLGKTTPDLSLQLVLLKVVIFLMVFFGSFWAKLLQLLIKSMVLKVNAILLMRFYQIGRDCFTCLTDNTLSHCHICLIHSTVMSQSACDALRLFVL